MNMASENDEDRMDSGDNTCNHEDNSIESGETWYENVHDSCERLRRNDASLKSVSVTVDKEDQICRALQGNTVVESLSADFRWMELSTLAVLIIGTS